MIQSSLSLTHSPDDLKGEKPEKPGSGLLMSSCLSNLKCRRQVIKGHTMTAFAMSHQTNLVLISRSMDSMWTATGSPPSSDSSPDCAYPSLLRPVDISMSHVHCHWWIFRARIPTYLYLALSFSLSPPSQWQPELSSSPSDFCRLRSDLSNLGRMSQVSLWHQALIPV